MLSARAPLNARHTHMFAFCPFVLWGFATTCVAARWCKTGNETGIAKRSCELRMIFQDFDMIVEKKHAVELLRQFCRLMRRFCAADGCLLTFTRAHSLTSVHRRWKCTRTFPTRGSFYACSAPQRFPRIQRAPKARAKKNWRFCGKYGAKVSWSTALGLIILRS